MKNDKPYNLYNAECIGYGNFAKVYKLFSRELKCNVAIRVVNKSKYYLEDIIKEKNINRDLMKVESPHILKIYDIQDNEKQMLYVTELCEGGSLCDVLNEQHGNKLEVYQTVDMILRIARGIQVLHNNKITHRDLKPYNILLRTKYVRGKPPDIKIADFGLSTKKLIMETLAGTKEYIAPEQAKYQSYTNAVDVWALGIIMDEMLHGATYYTGDTTKEIFQKIINYPYHVRDLKINPELQELLQAMLKKKPFYRPTIGYIIVKLYNWLKKSEDEPLRQLETNRSRNSSRPRYNRKVYYAQPATYNYLKCQKHLLPIGYIHYGYYLCEECFEYYTVPIEQYLKSIQQPESKLFKIQYNPIELVWNVPVPDETYLAKEFQYLKKRFTPVNLPLKTAKQLQNLPTYLYKMNKASSELEQTYRNTLDKIKGQLFQQLSEQLNDFLSVNLN